MTKEKLEILAVTFKVVDNINKQVDMSVEDARAELLNIGKALVKTDRTRETQLHSSVIAGITLIQAGFKNDNDYLENVPSQAELEGIVQTQFETLWTDADGTIDADVKKTLTRVKGFTVKGIRLVMSGHLTIGYHTTQSRAYFLGQTDKDFKPSNKHHIRALFRPNYLPFSHFKDKDGSFEKFSDTLKYATETHVSQIYEVIYNMKKLNHPETPTGFFVEKKGADGLNLDSVSSYDEALKCATALISYMKVNIHLSNGKLGRDVIDDTLTLKEKQLMATSLFEVLESIGHKMEKARMKFNADAELYKIKLDEGKPVDEAYEALDPKEEEKETKLPMVKKTKPTDPSKKIKDFKEFNKVLNEELKKETQKTEDKNMKLAVEEKKEVKEIAEEISSLENSNPFQQIANIRKK